MPGVMEHHETCLLTSSVFHLLMWDFAPCTHDIKRVDIPTECVTEGIVLVKVKPVHHDILLYIMEKWAVMLTRCL